MCPPPLGPVMEYAALVEVYERLAETDSTDRTAAIVAETLAAAEADLLSVLVRLLRGRPLDPWEEGDLGVSSSLTRRAIERATGVGADEIETRWRETGDLGDAAAWAVANRRQRTLVSEPLTVRAVHDRLRGLADLSGAGSQGRRVETVAGLVADADSPAAARYLVRTALGHLRLGVGDGALRDAIARAFLDGEADAGADAVERAHQLTTDYTVVARRARAAGRDGLAALDLEIGRPVESMLARPADGLAAGLVAVAGPDGGVVLEQKYDGARIQVHVRNGGDEVRLFTRRLVEVTDAFPDLVAAVRRRVDAECCLLDGEAVGYDPETGAPVPFQEFSRRIKREHDVAVLAREVPATVHAFDCLSLDGETLLDASLDERRARLAAVLDGGRAEDDPGRIEPASARRLTVAADEPAAVAESVLADARSVRADALDRGHEGLMMKNPAAAYEPGRRVGTMAKLKPTIDPLDLVVVGATYSEGRRRELLGRLHLACRDGDELRAVGRLSTGYTDAELEALTDRLEALVVARDGRTVELRPAVVLAVECEAVQASTEYDSGYALRFPRFLRVRDDLGPDDADGLDRIERLHEGAAGDDG